MSQSTKEHQRSFLAENDLSSDQYRFVTLGTNANEVDAAGASDMIVGVLQNTPEAGEAASVRFGGTSKVEATGAISKGDRVTADADGKATATTTDGAEYGGIALEAAAADGDIIEVLLIPGGIVSNPA